MAPTIASVQLQRSLLRLITFDQVTCLAAVGVILGVHTWVHRSGYLVILAVIVVITAGVMGLGRRPHAAGNLEGAVLYLALANWGVALAATTVATFCLPITVVAAMLPSVLAVPYVRPRLLARINAVSMCVSMLAVVLGTTQDFSGLTDDLAPWIAPAVLVAFVPFITGLVVMVSAQNSARLGRAFVEALEANDRLHASERALRESRARLVVATDAERRRIARDLHDGAQQRLIAMALAVRSARALVHRDAAGADALLDRLSAELRESMTELRNLAHGVHPAVLSDRGLGEALTELTARAACRCHVRIGAVPRCSPEVEASVYWCCVEALQNVAKHAGPDARVELRLAPRGSGALVFDVEDDGPGFEAATVTRGQGLSNMADRIGAVGGELAVRSAPGGGVRVRGVVPALDRRGAADDRFVVDPVLV